MNSGEALDGLEPGMPILYGGNRITRVTADLADAFAPGDHLLVVQEDGALLHIPADIAAVADSAVARAKRAFSTMAAVPDEAITAFYRAFARRLADDDAFRPIAEANAADMAAAAERGRSTTRLELSERMRSDMIEGLEGWASMEAGRDRIIETVDHGDWRVDLVTAGVGVVGFVFEGRPNVFADATGVLRSGNTVVFRIGSDALGTARAIVEHALEPAISESGLPDGAVTLLDSPARAAGWAMFSNPDLSLAVARGSGAAVAQLGAVARQSGVPVSLHGTGGAWVVVHPDADPHSLSQIVEHSLDRKVCNTLNTICLVRSTATSHLPAFLAGLRAAADRRATDPKLHAVDDAMSLLPEEWLRDATIDRAEGSVTERMAEAHAMERLGEEWEWENSPEVTLVLVDDVDQAARLYNDHSPKLVASLVGGAPDDFERFFHAVDSPFVGNGFTRWVDGQYALDRPELGLSNWQSGRLFGRAGVLSGDGVHTIRTRATHTDPGQRR